MTRVVGAVQRMAADLGALAYDMVHHPREVLLGRHHHQWVGAAYIAAACAPAALGWWNDRTLLIAVLLVAGPSWALDVAGHLVHIAWRRGRVWPDVACPLCGQDDGPDDADPDEDPDAPEDDGLVADVDAIEAWLRTLPAASSADRPA
jgi:hypothetical protein